MSARGNMGVPLNLHVSITVWRLAAQWSSGERERPRKSFAPSHSHQAGNFKTSPAASRIALLRLVPSFLLVSTITAKNTVPFDNSKQVSN